MKKIKLICYLLLLGQFIYSQETISTITKDYIANANKPSSELIKKLDAYPLESILETCKEQLSDSLVTVRKAIYEMVYIIALRKHNENGVNKAINMLISGCKDKDGGIVYTNLNYLKYFKSNDFDVEARIKLGLMAREGSYYFEQVVRLTGFVGITDLTYDYREMLQQKKYPNNKVRWALHIALARLGIKEEADYCLNRIRKLPISDDVVYDLLPDIVYVRSKEAFDYLLELIKSNEKSCSSSNPNSDAKIICAYRVIRLVAPFINDFPIKTDKGGDLIDRDYDKMLITVRQWIDMNKTSYTLNIQVY